jgi:hypothetical protein
VRAGRNGLPSRQMQLRREDGGPAPENFGGWGAQAKLEDLVGVTLTQ